MIFYIRCEEYVGSDYNFLTEFNSLMAYFISVETFLSARRQIVWPKKIYFFLES